MNTYLANILQAIDQGATVSPEIMAIIANWKADDQRERANIPTPRNEEVNP